MIEITGVLGEIAVPVKALYEQIAAQGWEVQKVEIKNKAFEARLKAPHGEVIRTQGRNEADALAKGLSQVLRRHMMRTPAQNKIGMLEPQWLDKLQHIAQAYAKAPLYDSKAAPAFKELGDDSLARAKVLKEHLKIEHTDEPEPYESAQDLHEDLQKRRHLFVSRHGLEHPLWNKEQQLAFQIVHDVLGHGVGGGEWDWHGANRAFSAHAPLLSAEAQKALFSETLGRTAYNQHFRSHAPHKIAFLTKYLKDLDHHGLGEPPSRIIVPNRPKLKTADVNEHFHPNVAPAQDNAYLWHRVDNIDPLDAQGLKQHADNLDIGFKDLKEPLQKQAVANAFRSSILHQGQTTKWGAIHYQDTHGIPYDVDDPIHYYKVLHDRRNSYNRARNFVAGVSHSAPFEDEIDHNPLASYIKATFPEMDQKDVLKRLEEELFHMICEEEELVKSLKPDLTSNDLEDAVIKAVQKRIKFITKASSEKHDYPHLASGELVRYHGFSHNALKSVARVSKNIDHLHEAAREDLERGGRGHYFRDQAKEVGIDPYTASRAWFHLAPKTSDLAPINEKHKDWLGDGDHFTLERRLMAGRNEAGYSHIPLGLFSQALEDYSTYGPFKHGEPKTVAPLNPMPYSDVDWHQPQQDAWSLPDWWKPTGKEAESDTQPPMQLTARTPWYVDREGMVVEGKVGQPLISLLEEDFGPNALALDVVAGKE